jgi:arsenite methyltransferase
MSNCVINLAPDKRAVFREAFRVLVPGGRLAISDIVATAAIPPSVASDPRAYTGCVAGAAPVAELEQALERAGFQSIRITVQRASRSVIADWSPGSGAEDIVASAYIQAVKPVSTAERADGANGPDAACCDTVLLDSCPPPAARTACCAQAPATARCGCQQER